MYWIFLFAQVVFMLRDLRWKGPGLPSCSPELQASTLMLLDTVCYLLQAACVIADNIAGSTRLSCHWNITSSRQKSSFGGCLCYLISFIHKKSSGQHVNCWCMALGSGGNCLAQGEERSLKIHFLLRRMKFVFPSHTYGHFSLVPCALQCSKYCRCSPSSMQIPGHAVSSQSKLLLSTASLVLSREAGLHIGSIWQRLSCLLQSNPHYNMGN